MVMAPGTKNGSFLQTRTWSSTSVDLGRVDFDYNGRGLRTELRRYSDVAGTDLVGRTETDYNFRGQATSILHKDAIDAVLADYKYFYGDSGLLDRETHHGQDWRYLYDKTGQLTP